MAVYNFGKTDKDERFIKASDILGAATLLAETQQRKRQFELDKEQAGNVAEATLNQARNLQLQGQRLALETAQTKQAIDKTNRDNAYSILERMSVMRENMDDTSRKMFDESEHVKEVTKSLFKKYIPEFVEKESGRPLWMSTQDVYKDKYDHIKSALAQKAANGQLTEQEATVFAIMSRVKASELAEVTSRLLKSKDSGEGSPNIFRKVLAFFSEKLNPLSGVLTAPPQTDTNKEIDPEELL